MNLLRRVQHYPRLKDWSLISRLQKTGVSLVEVERCRTARMIRLPRLSVEIDLEGELWMLMEYSRALDLVQRCGARFERVADGQILVTINGVRANLQTAEEVYMLWEIYMQNVYAFAFAQPVVVWDVGMNVGLASLYFASHYHCPVLGYELFPQTFEQTQRNLTLNPELRPLVRGFNYGLGVARLDADLPYFSEKRGSLGFHYDDRISNVYSNACMTRVRVEPASSALQTILAEFPDRAVVAKLDCEGAEYDILEDLRSEELLRKVPLWMVEWHRRGEGHEPSKLSRIFQDAGFAVLERDRFEREYGMIYAVKSGGAPVRRHQSPSLNEPKAWHGD